MPFQWGTPIFFSGFAANGRCARGCSIMIIIDCTNVFGVLIFLCGVVRVSRMWTILQWGFLHESIKRCFMMYFFQVLHPTYGFFNYLSISTQVEVNILNMDESHFQLKYNNRFFNWTVCSLCPCGLPFYSSTIGGSCPGPAGLPDLPAGGWGPGISGGWSKGSWSLW